MSYSYVIPGERISSGRAKRWLLAYPVAQCLCLCAAACHGRAWPQPPGCGPVIGDIRDRHRRRLRLWTDFRIFAGLPAARAACALFHAVVVRSHRGGQHVSSAAGTGGPARISPAPCRTCSPPSARRSRSRCPASSTASRSAQPRLSACGARPSDCSAGPILSGFAWGIGHVAATAAAAYAAPLELTAFQAGTVHAACMVLQAALAGLVMLPALRLLAPRLSYYGPRVYRTALRTRG